MSDLKNPTIVTADGVILTVDGRLGMKQVSVDRATYERMESLYQASKRSWADAYSRWRDIGEYQGWVAGYDGAGTKAPRRTEF